MLLNCHLEVLDKKAEDIIVNLTHLDKECNKEEDRFGEL
jgi:hypothetical protein